MGILWHATPRVNLASIREYGLLTNYARGRMRAVWLHTWSRRADVAGATALRHQVERGEIVFVGVRVSRSAITRFRWGLWYTTADVRPEWLILPHDIDAQTKLYAECPW